MNVCPNCHNEYDSLGIHFNYCGHPDLSEYKKSLMVGGLMSDATLTKGSGRPQFSFYNSNKTFLEWYAGELGFMSNDVRLYETGEEKHQRNISYGFDVERDAEYSDLYVLTTVSHPINERLYSWYDGGNKQYPEELHITPTILKVWYCGDGNVNWDTERRGYPEIGCLNEENNASKILSMFDDTPISPTFSSGRIRVYSDKHKFFDWVGSPPRGMEYKWEVDDRSRYKKLFENN